ncbi:MAG: endonuclease/exonuclease/phosphatase family protein [Prosthecobacter sp.]
MNRFFITRRALWPAVFLGLTRLSAASVEPESVVFCSYNLKNWLTMDRFDLATKKTLMASPKPEDEKRRAAEIIAAIKPQILGVCEIGTADDLAHLQAHLKKLGLDLPHTEMAHGGDDQRRLALLSAFPIAARNSQTSLTYQLDGKTIAFQRGILDATIRITPAFEVRCLGLHLKSKREVEEADQALMRRHEARLLRKHMDNIFAVNPRVRLLAYGDFNEQRNEPAIDTIMGDRQSESAMLDVQLRDRQGEVWTHFWDSADTYSRLDYFFASRFLRPHLDYRRSFIYSSRDFDKASDHRPIVTTLRLEPFVSKRPTGSKER